MGVYGTIGGFLTLLAAAAAAFYARDAARAANESLAHSKQSSEAELRPWLEMKLVADTLSVNEKQLTISYKLKVTNIGKLPAVSVFREIKLFNFGPEQETDIPEFFESEFTPWPGTRARTILPQGKIDLDGQVTMSRDELKITESSGQHYIHPVLAVRLVYQWGDDKSGQTCQSFGVYQLRSQTNSSWRPIMIRLDRMTNTFAAVRPTRFDSIR